MALNKTERDRRDKFEKKVEELEKRMAEAAEMIVEKLDRLDKMDHDLKTAILNINRKLDGHIGTSTIEHLMKGVDKP